MFVHRVMDGGPIKCRRGAVIVTVCASPLNSERYLRRPLTDDDLDHLLSSPQFVVVGSVSVALYFKLLVAFWQLHEGL